MIRSMLPTVQQGNYLLNFKEHLFRPFGLISRDTHLETEEKFRILP